MAQVRIEVVSGNHTESWEFQTYGDKEIQREVEEKAREWLVRAGDPKED